MCGRKRERESEYLPLSLTHIHTLSLFRELSLGIDILVILSLHAALRCTAATLKWMWRHCYV